MEREFEIRGFYRPHFFSIYINGVFSKDLQELSKKDLGTFVHEYTHYLQNVTSIFGLRYSSHFFRTLFEVKKFIVENESFTIPLMPEFSQGVLNGRSEFDKHLGHKEVVNINEIEEVKFEFEPSPSTFEDPILKMKILMDGKELYSIHLGNLCVKEGMARLVQKIYDEDVEHPIYYYSVVELLAKQLNPEILKDERKLIALCILALNAQNCIKTLYDLLIETREFPELDGKELFSKYQKERWIIHKSKKINIKQFALESLEKFHSELKFHVNTKLIHFEKLIQNIQYSIESDSNPLIEILYSNQTEIAKLTDLISFYGIPLVRDIHDNEFSPNTLINGKNGPSLEFNDLFYQSLVIERLFTKNGICNNLGYCERSKAFDIDDNCFSTQWLRKDNCPFKLVSNNWGLKDKIES